MDPLLNRQAAFWDARSASYHGAREPGTAERVAARLAVVPEAARPAAGKRVLDVGAGTGAMSLHAADLGAEVTALDVSPGMLARLAAEAGTGAGTGAGAGRIETVCGDWRTLDVDGLGWRRRFDLVVAQMVPIFREVADFERFEACARDWCVFIGWGRLRRDTWLEAAFAAHGAVWSTPPGVPQALELLAAIGRRPATVYRPETWTRRRPVAAVVRDAADHLFVRGVEPDLARLSGIAEEMATDGVVEDSAAVEIGVLAWQV